MNISPVTQNNFSSAVTLLKHNNLPTGDLSDTTKLFVLEDGNTVTGTIGLEYDGEFGLLRSLSVDQNNRNHGYGKELVDFIEDYAKEKGVKSLFLLTTTAEQFFGKRKYMIVERNTVPAFIAESSEFSSVCPASAIVMKKEL